MNIPYFEIIIASLISVAVISPESHDLAGVIGISSKGSERITGTWTSYSPTKFGAMNVDFVGNGTCQFRKGANETVPCKWQETDKGEVKIDATVSGRDEVFSASVTGDYLVVTEPGRETPYVRTNSKAAHERQQQAKGPSNPIPWAFETRQK